MSDTKLICEMLDGARGHYAASGASTAIALIQKRERDQRAEPTTKSECDDLLRSLIRAWSAILAVFAGKQEAQALAANCLDAVAGLIVACSQTYAEREAIASHLMAWHSLARIIRNELHNISLLRDLEALNAAKKLRAAKAPLKKLPKRSA